MAAGDDEVAVASLASIDHLCREGVIDVLTTVGVLSPKLKGVASPRVASAFLPLLSIAGVVFDSRFAHS